jgi:hypothetical protein
MDKDSQKPSTTSIAVIAIVAAAGLAFAIPSASIPAALAQESVSGNGLGTIKFQSGVGAPREFDADVRFQAQTTVVDGESTLTGFFTASNPDGLQGIRGEITEGEIGQGSYMLKGTGLQSTIDGEPTGPACEEGSQGCDFILHGKCGEDVSIRFVAPSNIHSTAQGDVLCTN